MKILILRFSSIGDIVLTSPVMRCIKKRYPEAEVHYTTKKAFHSIVQHNPYITKIHLLGDSLMDLVSELKQEKFDYIIDLHNNQRTLLIKLLLGVKSFSFDKLNFEKWLMVNFKINRLPQSILLTAILKPAKELDVTNDGEGLDYFIAKQDEVNLDTFPEAFHKGYVAWVIGAKQNTKKFPLEKIAAAINNTTWPVMLLGGPEDRAEAEAILNQIQQPAKVFNAAGKFSLNQSASLVQQAAWVVTNDTGLMHIAAAFKRPVISIWGNTIPAFGMYPYHGNKSVSNIKIQVNDLPCRPCSKLGYQACPKGHFKCMKLIDERQISDLLIKS